jgi:hypothetical protein
MTVKREFATKGKVDIAKAIVKTHSKALRKVKAA